jgi:hypothetical protein
MGSPVTEVWSPTRRMALDCWLNAGRQSGNFRSRLRRASSFAYALVARWKQPADPRVITRAAFRLGLCAAVNSTLESRNTRISRI